MLLITLVSIHPYPSPQSVPLANAFLKSAARETSVNISLVDLFIGHNPAHSALLLAATNPCAIGFSMYVWNRVTSLELAAELRKLLPSTLIFAGGPEATADPSGVLKSELLDFVIVGEGELPFTAICEHLIAGTTLSGIPGIMFCKDEICAVPGPIANLDSIASPYLNEILDTHNYTGILWQLARGCSFSCDFCFDARDNFGVRRFSLERIEAELRHFAVMDVAQIFVLDSTFNHDAKRAKQILRMIKKIAPRIHFHFEVRSEFIDREMSELFAKITCSLQIGLQSADALVLKQVGRSFKRDDFSRRVGFLNDCGAVFGFDLIYGLPGDTLSGFCNSMDYALSLYPNHLDIFPLSVLPGTRLASNGTKLGLVWQTAPPYNLVSTSNFSGADLSAARQLANACDIFFTRGKAVAWFNAVVHVLQIKPSNFMRLFSEWLTANERPGSTESDFNDAYICDLQKRFLQQLFRLKNTMRFFPIVLDLVNYHYQYALALLAPQKPPATILQSRIKILNSIFCLAPSTRLVHFNYQIQEILDSGAPDIGWIYKHLKSIGSNAVIYPNNNFVCTESLDSMFFSLLKQLNGTTKTEEVLNKLGVTLDDALDFLLFSQQHRIIETV